MRPKVVSQLISFLRESGYPGYELDGVNSLAKVEASMDKLYVQKYGMAEFIPSKVRELFDARKLTGHSIVQDKVATPSELARSLPQWETSERPQYLLAESSSRALTDVHEYYKHLFQEHSTVRIQSGTTMISQFKPSFLGLSHP